MMKFLLLLVVLTTLIAFGASKHIHPRSIITMQEEAGDEIRIAKDIDGVPIEVIQQLRPSRLVPVNNVLFFQRFPPCEDGFDRDVLGVCREVWD